MKKAFAIIIPILGIVSFVLLNTLVEYYPKLRYATTIFFVVIFIIAVLIVSWPKKRE